MSLSAHIKYVRDWQKTLVVFNHPNDSRIVADLQDYFSTQNVAVTSKKTQSGEPDSIAVLQHNGEILASVPVAKLEELIAGGGLRETGIGVRDTEYQDILQYLKETTFTSYDKSNMVTISHEIENRALRVNEGRLYAGFQRPEKLNAQAHQYTQLANQSLEINTFAVPGDQIKISGITHHTTSTEEIEQSWFVIFDGGGTDTYKTALLATEEEPDQFYGFWSDDPELVDSIWKYLDREYLTARH